MVQQFNTGGGGEVAPKSLVKLKLLSICSRNDAGFRAELERHISIPEKEGLIERSGPILGGDDVSRKIAEHLEKADIIIFLVSPDFNASDDSFDKNVARALSRHEAGEARVIPVHVRSVAGVSSRFAHLLALPSNAKAVTNPKWKSRDDAWTDVAKGLGRVIDAAVRGQIIPGRLGVTSSVGTS